MQVVQTILKISAFLILMFLLLFSYKRCFRESDERAILIADPKMQE